MPETGTAAVSYMSGVELDVTEPGLRSMQRRVSDIRTRRLRERLASTPVTCSASQKYSASVRYRVTGRGDPTALGRVRAAARRGW